MTIAIVEVPTWGQVTIHIYDPDERIITAAWSRCPAIDPNAPKTVEAAIAHLCSGPDVHIVICCADDIAKVEDWEGRQPIVVRAMAAELRELFPAEPEAEPEEEYVLRHDDGKVVVCGNCKYPAPTWRSRLGGEGAREKLRCEVCFTTPHSTAYPATCFQANMLLAAIEKIRPAEGELATPAELQIRKLNRIHFGKLRAMRGAIAEYAENGTRRTGDRSAVKKAVFQYMTDLLEVEDSQDV